MEKSFYIESLGCVTNKADTARVEKFLVANGWQNANLAEASLICLMTCAFTKSSEDLNVKRLRQIQKEKKRDAQLIVGGCLPSINSDRLFQEFNGFTFSPRTMESLDQYISANIKMALIPPVDLTDSEKTTVNIRISTGCMGRCTYCAIPFSNGRTKSRSIDDIVSDINSSIDKGFKKIKLVSEDIGAYGQDLNQSIVKLLDFIISIDLDIELYLDNLNPNWFYTYRNELTSLFRSDKIVKRFSIPIQSGSDRILKRMGRKYTIHHVRNILDQLYVDFNDVQVCTDFIVGFPTEADTDFEDTRRVAKSYPFNFMEIFTYEDRLGTKASTITAKLSSELKENRRQILFMDFFRKFINANDIKNPDDFMKVLKNHEGLPIHFNIAD